MARDASADNADPQLLDADVINRAEALGLGARQVVEGFLVGEHKSPFHGFSIEFTQHREYTAGDDLRHLDWKVLGRTDRYYIKQYEQETNFVAHLLVDASESMTYASGEVSKLWYAKQLAACLAYVILKQRDACALYAFGEEVALHVPRTGNLGAMRDLCLRLARLEPQPGTDVAGVLHRIGADVKRRGIVVLVSGLFDDEEKIVKGLQHARFAGHEVIVFHVLDPQELHFDLKGNVELIGLETDRRLSLRPREVRKSYLAGLEAFLERVRYGCERAGAHYTLFDTSKPMSDLLGGYLGFRRRLHRA